MLTWDLNQSSQVEKQTDPTKLLFVQNLFVCSGQTKAGHVFVMASLVSLILTGSAVESKMEKIMYV